MSRRDSDGLPAADGICGIPGTCDTKRPAWRSGRRQAGRGASAHSSRQSGSTQAGHGEGRKDWECDQPVHEPTASEMGVGLRWLTRPACREAKVQHPLDGSALDGRSAPQALPEAGYDRRSHQKAGPQRRLRPRR